ncbi:PilW family protein [Paraburkholderia unamae]|uniref:Type IV pilus assembly protein PilW n=1 Tax=Paraburkholderia unamae TaxID=219649 RepID=A0ABX5KFX4_9BURK|nr:PilW family protein [Paraburkholderia unamae]PVX77843.1 type IV pilus assembly protein PilW [Paraburkholderia unamae]CAG9256556.1 Type IV fimbrial biogenesis protein PilW [Paraburkholderia unamae]
MKPKLTLARRGAGHTLLELTIAVALGLVVTLGALAAYRSQRQAFAYASDAARIHEAGMNALLLMGEQIQMAGFVAADTRVPLAGPAIFGCMAGRPVGADAALACESLSGRSDGLALRYQGDGVSTWPAANGQVTDCLGQAAGAAGSEIVNRYHAKASASTGEPELYCEGSGKVGTAQPLVEGVERLRLRYWTAGAAQPVDASVLARDQWASVVAVDLCVLVRGGAFPRRTHYVDCEGAQGLGADGRARQAFWRHIVLRNAALAAS